MGVDKNYGEALDSMSKVFEMEYWFSIRCQKFLRRNIDSRFDVKSFWDGIL